MADQPKTEVLATTKPATDGKGRKPAGPMQLMAEEISSRQASFAAVATKYLSAERIVKLAQVAIAKNPDLAYCTTMSVLDCLMTCTRLGLEPGEAGGVWLVPFKKQCTAIIDYRGLIDVCRRSGQIGAVHSAVRYEHDEFEYWIDTAGPTLVHLKHRPKEGDRGKPVGAYFVAKLKDGECQAVYLDQKAIEAYRDRSRAYTSGGQTPWRSDPMAMWQKTVIRRGVNLLPKTPEMQVVWEQLKQEDVDDDVDIVGELPEGSEDAIGRMVADIAAKDKATADGIEAAFKAMEYGPARRLQLLTKYQADPRKLLTWLQYEAGPVAIAVTAVDAAGKEANPAPMTQADANRAHEQVLGGQPAGMKIVKQPAKKETKPAKGKTKGRKADTKPATGETKQAEPETPAPAAPKADLPDGASF